MPEPPESLLAALQAELARGRWQAAELTLRHLELSFPQAAGTAWARGSYHAARSELSRAAAGFQLALNRNPASLQAAWGLAECETLAGNYTAAAQALEQLLRQAPYALNALERLVGLYQLCGRSQPVAALAEVLLQPRWRDHPLYRQQPEADRRRFEAWLPQLDALRMLNRFAADEAEPGQTPALLAAWRQRWVHADGRQLPPRHADRQPDRRLTVGFVSREWGSAPLELGFGGLFPRLMADFELIAYCDQGRPADASPFRRVVQTGERSDQDFAAQVRADAVDVLIDLSGFFNARRLLSLQLRPAPVQLLAGANPPFAAGLSAFDGVLGDELILPAGTLAELGEHYRVQASFFRWQAPRRPAPPRTSAAGLRLGVLASPNKINRFSLELWGRALACRPEASLSFRHQAWSDPLLRNWLLERFAAVGGAAERVHFVDNRLEQDYLAFLAEQHLILDSFPYGGALSSCDAIWMEVPVLSLRGGQRLGETLLTRLNAPELLAANSEDFLARLAQFETAELIELGRRLKPRLLASPICDLARQAADYRRDIRYFWQLFCAGSQA